MANSFDGIYGFVTESSAGGISYDLVGAFLTEQAAVAAAGVARLTTGALIDGGVLADGKLVKS